MPASPQHLYATRDALAHRIVAQAQGASDLGKAAPGEELLERAAILARQARYMCHDASSVLVSGHERAGRRGRVTGQVVLQNAGDRVAAPLPSARAARLDQLAPLDQRFGEGDQL